MLNSYQLHIYGDLFTGMILKGPNAGLGLESTAKG